MKTLTTWNPFRELDEVQSRFNTFFGGFPTRLFGNGKSIKLTDWSPQVDILEDDHEYFIKADVPEIVTCCQATLVGKPRSPSHGIWRRT